MSDLTDTGDQIYDLQNEIEAKDKRIAELEAELNDAFLAGVDYQVLSRSRMDMPRDRIGLLRYWKTVSAAAKENDET